MMQPTTIHETAPGVIEYQHGRDHGRIKLAPDASGKDKQRQAKIRAELPKVHGKLTASRYTPQPATRATTYDDPGKPRTLAQALEALGKLSEPAQLAKTTGKAFMAGWSI